MTGAQAEGVAIPEAVAMEMTAMEAEPTSLVAEATEGVAPELGTIVGLEVRVETRVDPLLGASTDIVVGEPVIEEVALIRSTPMSETTSTSRGGLELLDDNLIDLAVVARSMESWHRTELWIKVRCEYPE
jgi:hypothetical protein